MTVENGYSVGAGTVCRIPPSSSVLDNELMKEARKPPEKLSPGLHDFLLDAKGIIHIGGHVGQERDAYGDKPVIWIEANPRAFQVLREQIAEKPNQKAWKYLVADGGVYELNISNFGGISSSIFPLGRHKELWPEVEYVDSVKMPSFTLAEIIEEQGIDFDVYDTLVLDVQGAEELVLKGAGEYLKRFRFIMAEAADFECYDGGCTLNDIDLTLDSAGFVRLAMGSYKSVEGVGSYHDVVYRNTVLEPRENDDYTVLSVKDKSDPVRLNLGSGREHIDGFSSIDRIYGTEIYPLDVADNSVDEILASHVLEHFSHTKVADVLRHWVQKLKPGGKIRLAVPDFLILANDYLDGKPINLQGYVMGGHYTPNDHHGTIFDRELLTELMIASGLERIGLWKSEYKDVGSSLPISLNLQGFKPFSGEKELKNVRMVYSTPRFGPLLHCRCIERAVHALRLEAKGAASCFWHQLLSVLMEEAIADPNCEYVLTADFDTIFSSSDILELYRLMKACPDVDAIFPLQSKRGAEQQLFNLLDAHGRLRFEIADCELERHLIPAHTGHFGLTMIRAESLRKLKRPWMMPVPSKEGTWSDSQIDADITFWMNAKEAGWKFCLAPRIVVGHLEELIKWPGKDLKTIYQGSAEYQEKGIPAEVMR